MASFNIIAKELKAKQKQKELREMISKDLFERTYKGCIFGEVEDKYIIHYSQPCSIMEGSWINSEVTIYEFAIDVKIEIEKLAKEKKLSAVFIDLNKFVESQTEYFRNCDEIFEWICKQEQEKKEN